MSGNDLRTIGIIAGVLAVIVLLIKFKYKNNEANSALADIEQQISGYAEDSAEAKTPAERLKLAMKKASSALYKQNLLQEQAVKLWQMVQDAEQPLLVVVMGEFKTGKSTFINTLLGDSILKTDATPATAVVSMLKYGEERAVTLHYRDGRQEEYDFGQLTNITAEGDDSYKALRDSLDYVEVAYPNEMLKQITLVDTPGLNDHGDKRVESTTQFQHKADVVLWVFSVEKPASRTELAEIETLGERLKPIAIVNRIDTIDEEEESVEEVLDNIRRRLGDSVQTVLGVSAKEAAQAMAEDNQQRLQECGWQDFQQYWEKQLRWCSEELKLQALHSKVEEYVRDTLAELENQKQKLDVQKAFFSGNHDQAMAELQGKIDAVAQEINKITRACNMYEAKLKSIANHEPANLEEAFKDNMQLGRIGIKIPMSCDDFGPIVETLPKGRQYLDNLSYMEEAYHKLAMDYQDWRNMAQQAIDDNNALEKEDEHISYLHSDYKNSGLFGGEPIFDFSGRRARLNQAIQDNNNHREQLVQLAARCDDRFKIFIDDCGKKYDDTVKILNWIAKMLEEEKEKLSQEKQRLSENYDREKQVYEEKILQLQESSAIITALQNEVKVC